MGLRARYNERQDFLITTTTPIDENTPARSTLFVPHYVDSNGYTTEFVLFRGDGTEPITGFLTSFTQAGKPVQVLQ